MIDTNDAFCGGSAIIETYLTEFIEQIQNTYRIQCH